MANYTVHIREHIIQNTFYKQPEIRDYSRKLTGWFLYLSTFSFALLLIKLLHQSSISNNSKAMQFSKIQEYNVRYSFALMKPTFLYIKEIVKFYGVQIARCYLY